MQAPPFAFPPPLLSLDERCTELGTDGIATNGSPSGRWRRCRAAERLRSRNGQRTNDSGVAGAGQDDSGVVRCSRRLRSRSGAFGATMTSPRRCSTRASRRARRCSAPSLPPRCWRSRCRRGGRRPGARDRRGRGARAGRRVFRRPRQERRHGAHRAVHRGRRSARLVRGMAARTRSRRQGIRWPRRSRRRASAPSPSTRCG